MRENILAAVKILGEAERRLREQMQVAASQGEYETLLLITGWAKKVAELSAEAPVSHVESTATIPIPLPPSKSGVRKSSHVYPQFFRSGNALAKIAWSKSERAEYEHRAPVQVLTQLVAAMDRVAGRHRFTMEAVLSNITMPDGTEIPTYQTYLCLAFLRHEDLVVQHGRQGYSMKAGVELATEARARLARLPDIRSRTLLQEE